MSLTISAGVSAFVNGALQVAETVRDAFAARTNAKEAERLSRATGGGGTASSTPQGLPWDASTVLEGFDLSTLGSSACGFQGTVFDGRFVYWVPYGAPEQSPSQTPLDVCVAYDTSLPFGVSSSYQAVSLTTAVGTTLAKGFLGCVLDPNGYLYFVPQAGAYPSTSGLVVRYDTSKLLSDSTAYSTFDVTTVSAFGSNPQSGYGSGTCDGRYLYIAPTQSGTYTPTASLTAHGWAVRYDTTKVFSSTNSWVAYNLPVCLAESKLKGYQSLINDGTFVYYIPFGGPILARYQIGQAFQTTSSWATFDLSTLVTYPSQVAPTGATRIGRYIYLTPWRNLYALPGTTYYNSIILRYDTQAPGGLTAIASWTTFDLNTIVTPATTWIRGYQGSVSDGIYLYLVPAFNGSSINPANQVPPFLRYDVRLDFTDPTSWPSCRARQHPGHRNY